MYVPYILKELGKRKARTAGVVLTVAIITAMMIFTTALMAAYSTAIYLPFENIDANLILQRADNTTTALGAEIRAPFGKGAFPQETADIIATMPHVENISKSLIVWHFKKEGFSTVEGVEPESPWSKKLRSWVTSGRFLIPTDKNVVILESHFAKFNHEKVGDTILLGNETFQIIGILAVQEGSQVFASNMYIALPDAQRLSNISSYNQIYIKLDDLSNEDSVRSAISSFDKQIIILSGSALSPSVSNFASIYRKFYLLGITFITLISALILIKITVMGLLERRKDIAVMQAVGWRRRDILRQLLAEFLLQVSAGFVIGVIVAIAMATALGTIHIQSKPTGLEQPVDISAPLTITLLTVFEYFLLIIVISATVAYILSRKIAAIKPIDNLRSI